MAENRDKYLQLDEVIRENKGKQGAVMITLQAAQNIFEHVPRLSLIHIWVRSVKTFDEKAVFASKELLDIHLEKHLKEYGDVSEDEYCLLYTSRCV